MAIKHYFPQKALDSQTSIKKVFTVVTLVIAIGVPIELREIISVSYKHLTLPTKRIV